MRIGALSGWLVLAIGCGGAPRVPEATTRAMVGAAQDAPSSRGAVSPAAAAPGSRSAPAAGALTPDRAVRFRRPGDLRFSPDGAKIAFVLSEATDVGTESHVWMADVRGGEVRAFTSSRKSERSPRWSPDGRTLAFLSSRGGEMQVYAIPTGGGEATPLTSAEGGVGDYAWSPDGKNIAFLARAAGSKTDGPHPVDREQDLERVWILDVVAKKARQVTTAPYAIHELTWPIAGRLVVVANAHPRAESWDDGIFSVGIADGRFVEVARPAPPFSDIVPSPSGAQLAFVGTAASGPMPHDLFLTPSAGGPARNVSRALDRPVLSARWQGERAVVLRASDGFRNALYRLEAPAFTPALVDLPLSARTIDVARDGTIAFVGVAFNRLPELFLKPKAGPVRQMGRLQEEAWKDVALVDAEIFRVASFDGATVEAALLKPSSSPGARKQPLVLLVHGGPNSNFSSDYFWFNAWAQLLVARGYQVLLVNPRGSTGYGEAFVKANRGDWGGGDYKDLIAVLDHVLARGEVDPARLGIGGWSYGAEMTAWAIGHTTRFAAAVAGAGVFDQAAEFGTENGPAGDEWHFGTPWNNPDVFAKNSPSSSIKNAKTPTLIVHGEADRNNPIGQSQALYRALKHLGVETELVTYPGEPHGPQKAKNQRDIMERMLAWFDAHLG